MSKLAPLTVREIPPAPPLRRLIGPSFILLGLGLGSGELILWPYLASNYGLGIMWAAVLGITFQFFLNMEIARYTLINGESIFVGLMRKFGRLAPGWFLFSTFLPWIWPGIIAASATLLAASFGWEYSHYLAIALLVAIGLILSLGSVVYKTQEKLQKAIIVIGIPFVFLLAFIFASPTDWASLGAGLVGIGDGYFLLPIGIPIATLLGAFAYAGAGGNLNLSQSYYVKEKGYAMGKYAGRITSVLTGKKEHVTLEGVTFEPNQKNLQIFSDWWKRVNAEHLIVFWLTGAVTMLIMSLLAYSTVFGMPGLETGINFVVLEGRAIGSYAHPILGILFLITAGVMLFGTQFSVFGSTSRIMSENLILLSDKFKVENSSKYFYFFLWLQILAGIAIFLVGFTEPLTLVITGAVLNAITMFFYSAMVLWLNLTSLDKALRPNALRVFAIVAAFLFYGGFSGYVIYQNVSRFFS
jgi:hypothetical protein